MPVSDYVTRMRAHIGHDLLLLPGAGGVVRDDRGRILLHRRGDTGRWSLPAGMIEPGEQPAEAYLRELYEETGVVAEIERLAGVGTQHSVYPNGDVCEYLVVWFRCRAVGGEARPDGDESLAVGWFAPDELPELNDTALLRIRTTAEPDAPPWFAVPGRDQRQPDAVERETRRTTFGADAERYDRARPGYPAAVFTDLAELTGLGPGSRVLEIGCGTGQATRQLTALGATVLAVELSPQLAAVARRNVPQAVVEVAAFEQWTPPAEPFDLVVSATAFHWLDPAVRVPRAAGMLRPGGALAVIHSEHVAGGTEKFFVDAQACYERFDPDTPPGLRLTPAERIPRDAGEIERSGLFGPATFRRYEWEQAYTTESYLDVLMTYSGHLALPPAARDGLLACLAGLIERDHGGRISKRYLTQVTVARRGQPSGAR